jgi:iron complex outermembrane receptor protein
MPEVLVTASKAQLNRASVAGFSDTPLLETPASVNVISAQQMQDLQIHSTTDAARYDASLSDAYNAVGYAEQFSIRGFKLDNATSYRKDGMAIPGDTQIPLENKERIEVLKGLSGLQAGVSAPGGVINYVTKRPTEQTLRTVILEERERGNLYGTVDLGGRFEDARFGYRVNLAAERLRSYIKGADGNRKFAAAAFDWRSRRRPCCRSMATTRKSAVTAPGYQLLNNTTLPVVAADTMLNDQPWSRPVETTSSNLGVRFAYSSRQSGMPASAPTSTSSSVTTTPPSLTAAAHKACILAIAAMAISTSTTTSAGREKSPLAQALLQGRFVSAGIDHAVTFGARFKNSEKWGDYLYTLARTARQQHLPPHGGGTSARRSGLSERRHTLDRAVFAQDMASLTEQLKLHAGARAQIKRDEYVGADDKGVALQYAHTDTGYWLPNVALVYALRSNVSVYGSLAQGMEYGGVAPLGTSNQGRALAPNKSKQVEVGVKADVHPDLSASVALFQIRKGLEYTSPRTNMYAMARPRTAAWKWRWHGRVSRALSVGAIATALNTQQHDTGVASLDGKRVTDVAAFKSRVCRLRRAASAGLEVGANWQYSGKKAFDSENKVFVPSYHVVNLSAPMRPAWATRRSRCAPASTTRSTSSTGAM